MALKNAKTGELTFVGAVLSISPDHYLGFDRYGDYVTVWNAEKGCTEEIQYGWGYCTMSGYDFYPEVDATPETLEAYITWKTEVDRLHRELEQALMAERALTQQEQEKRRPARGKVVRVIKGRKVPVGFQGEIFWIGTGQWGERCGIKDADGRVEWTATSNVEVVLSEAS